MQKKPCGGVRQTMQKKPCGGAKTMQKKPCGGAASEKLNNNAE